MKAEKIKQLMERHDALVDVFLGESDPAEWPTMDTKEDRGDRVWHKKNALGTIQLAARIQDLIGRAAGLVNPDAKPDDEERELKDEIRAAEKMAKEVLARHGAKV